MLDNIALNVVIGLVFIYLLYSLLITILGEVFTSLLSLRAKVLRSAIERMLNDNRDDETLFGIKWLKGIIRNTFINKPKQFSYTLAGRFYNAPSISSSTVGRKSIFSLFKSRKPVSISRENFSQTLLHLFRSKGSGLTDTDKIKYCLEYNSLLIDPETLSYLKNLFADAGADVKLYVQNIEKWFDDTMIKTTAWYKRKLRLISFVLSFIVAASFNVDSIKIAQILAVDKDAREQLVTLAVEASKDSAGFLITAPADSSAGRIEYLDSSYNRLMKDINTADAVLGLGWNFSSIQNSDSAEVTGLSLTLLNIAESIPRLNRSIKILKEESASAVNDSVKKLLTDSIVLKEKYIAAINEFFVLNFIDVSGVASAGNSGNYIIYGKTGPGLYQKALFIAGKCSPADESFWGFLITAFMLSLGAPFWFDLLNKLAALKGGGAKTEDKKKEDLINTEGLISGTSFSALETDFGKGLSRILTVPAADLSGLQPSSIVRELERKLENKKGIIFVCEGFIGKGTGKKRGVRIIVENNEVFDIVSKEAEAMYPGNIIEVQVNTVAVIHGCEPGQTVYNPASLAKHGTLGCFLYKTGSDKRYFISCWHVVYGNPYSGSNDAGIIYDAGLKQIGYYVDGIWNNYLDVGIAELTTKQEVNNSSIKILSDWRNVSEKDALYETRISFKGRTSGSRNAVVYDHSLSYSLNYKSRGSHILNDLFAITSYNDENKRVSPSREGDSGSAIVDETGTPLGILVGGDREFSYCIKFSNILSANSIYREYKIII
jgi:hypothetical protein